MLIKTLTMGLLMGLLSMNYATAADSLLPDGKQVLNPDRREDIRDRREDVRDQHEDKRDANHDGGIRDKVEDVRDRREDVRDRREDRREAHREQGQKGNPAGAHRPGSRRSGAGR